MPNDNRPICHIDIYQRARCIERTTRFGKGDAVLLRNHCNSSLPPAVRSIELLGRLCPLFEVGRLVQAVPNLSDVAKNQILSKVSSVESLFGTVDDARLIE